MDNLQNIDHIRENLDTQLSELETLQSMFYNPGELRIEDLTVFMDMKSFVCKKNNVIPPYLDLTINLIMDGSNKFELCVNLSSEYPDLEPDLYVRNHKLTKSQHASLNKNLAEHITSLNRGEPCIFSAISWLQDNAENYVSAEEVEERKSEKNEALVRYWIYSHHIYSKTKRREIVDLAEGLKITGFCMPGKPGIICVEGMTSDCNEWWQMIKSMNWKRIFIKVIEDGKEMESGVFLKFKTFSEMVFQNNNIKNNHMDMGELVKYLEDHQCGHVFKEIFGVEARVSS